MLHGLPPELVIHILSFLPFQSLGALQQVSRPWNDFVLANQTLVYYNAAVVHNFIDSPAESLTSLNEVVGRLEGRLWRGVKSWKDFCECSGYPDALADRERVQPLLGRRRFQLERNWAGQGQSVFRNISPGRDDVHRLKVDEKERFCITTHMRGEYPNVLRHSGF